MNTIEDIRARREANYDLNDQTMGQFGYAMRAAAMAGADVDTLLAELSRMQAVVDAAYEMRQCISFRDVMYEYNNPEEYIKKWDDALAAYRQGAG